MQKPFIIPIFLPHGGCPHQCLFCDQRSITTCRDIPSPEKLETEVIKYLGYAKKKPETVQISFYGGNFLGLPPDKIDRLLHAAEKFVADGRVDSIRFSTRPDTISGDTLALLQNYKVTTIELGLQSLDNTVLAQCRRGHTAEQSQNALVLAKNAGYAVGAQIMTGLPGDTGPQTLTTVHKLIGLAPDFVRIYPTVVIAGTPLARQYLNGNYAPQTLTEAVWLTKLIYRRLRRHQLPVIRMGLQPSAALDRTDTILAGPYHPAFGHLVFSQMCLDEIRRQLGQRTFSGKKLIIRTAVGNAARVRGLKNQNLKTIQDHWAPRQITVTEDAALSKDQVQCQIVS